MQCSGNRVIGVSVRAQWVEIHYQILMLNYLTICIIKKSNYGKVGSVEEVCIFLTYSPIFLCSVMMANFSHWFFGILCFGSKFWFFEKNGSILGQYFICPGVFLGRITTKNLSLCPWEITKKSFRRKLLKIFHFFTLWIWLFGIFDKRPQGCYEVKYSMGLLQGPRLMAWTTKSPIQGNHWVPLGCRALLGSVKVFF